MKSFVKGINEAMFRARISMHETQNSLDAINTATKSRLMMSRVKP